MLPEYPSWLQPGMLSVPHGRWRSLLTIRIHGAPMTSILKVKPPNQGLFQPKKESFGFQVYIYIHLCLYQQYGVDQTTMRSSFVIFFPKKRCADFTKERES